MELKSLPETIRTIVEQAEGFGLTGAFAYIGANENFSDFSPQGFFSDADRVFVEGHAAYTVTGTGKSVDTNFLHVFTITGGRITGFVEYFDTYQVVLAGR